MLTDCQMVRAQIRSEVLAVLIWVQTVYKGYHQTTKVTANKKRVKVRLCHQVYFSHRISLTKDHDVVFLR